MKVQANPLMIVAGRSRPQLTARSGQNRRVSSDFGKIWRKSTAKRHGPIAGAGGKAPPRTSSKPSGSTKAPTRIKHPDQGGGPTWASAVPALGAEQATHPATLPVAGDGIKTTASSKTGEKTDHNRAPAVPTFEAVKEAKTAQPSVGAASRAMTEAGRAAPNAVRAQPSADQIAAGTHRSANPSGSIATDPRGRRVFRAVFKPMSPKDTKWVSVHPAKSDPNGVEKAAVEDVTDRVATPVHSSGKARPAKSVGGSPHPSGQTGSHRSPSAAIPSGLGSDSRPGRSGPPTVPARQSVEASADQKLAPGWTIQPRGSSDNGLAKQSSWTIRPPGVAGPPMRMDLIQSGSQLKANLTVSVSGLGLVNVSPTALIHQAVHLPGGVSTLDFSLSAQPGNQQNPGGSAQPDPRAVPSGGYQTREGTPTTDPQRLGASLTAVDYRA